MAEAARAPTRLANRLLAEQDWARARLAPFAGRTVAFTVGPLTRAWCVGADGTLDDAADDAVADVRLAISPLALPSFLATPARWNEFVREEGDADLAGIFKDLALTLPWFVESALARALGPVAGQRAADTGRRLLAFPEYAAERMTDSAVGYARDEAELLARGGDMRSLTCGVEEVAERVAALAARLDAIERPPPTRK